MVLISDVSWCIPFEVFQPFWGFVGGVWTAEKLSKVTSCKTWFVQLNFSGGSWILVNVTRPVFVLCMPKIYISLHKKAERMQEFWFHDTSEQTGSRRRSDRMFHAHVLQYESSYIAYKRRKKSNFLVWWIENFTFFWLIFKMKISFKKIAFVTKCEECLEMPNWHLMPNLWQTGHLVKWAFWGT